MSRPLVLLLGVCLVATLGVCYYLQHLPVDITAQIQPAAAEPTAQDGRAVGSSVASRELPSVQRPDPRSLVGLPKAELIRMRGAPRSQLEAGGFQVLLYENFSYKLKAGQVVSVETQLPPSTNTRTPARMSRGNSPDSYARSSEPQEPSLGVVNPERYRDLVRERVLSWAHNMSINTKERYDPYLSELSPFRPVPGWANRFHAIGLCSVSQSHGTRSLPFEVYLQLTDQGDFKEAEVSARN